MGVYNLELRKVNIKFSVLNFEFPQTTCGAFMDKKLYDQIDEVLTVRTLFTDKSIYDVLELMHMQKGNGLHGFLASKYEFLDDLKYTIDGLQVSNGDKKAFFTRACDQIENEIGERAIELASQKFNELYQESVQGEIEERRIMNEYKLNKIEEFKLFVTSRLDNSLAVN